MYHEENRVHEIVKIARRPQSRIPQNHDTWSTRVSRNNSNRPPGRMKHDLGPRTTKQVFNQLCRAYIQAFQAPSRLYSVIWRSLTLYSCVPSGFCELVALRIQSIILRATSTFSIAHFLFPARTCISRSKSVSSAAYMTGGPLLQCSVRINIT